MVDKKSTLEERASSQTRSQQEKTQASPKDGGLSPKQGKYFYGLGRRKCAIARVKLFPKGASKFLVNQRDYSQYFPQAVWRENLELPFRALGLKEKFDLEIKILGGGLRSQSEACRLAISRCLVKLNPENKKILRAAGFMTRDPRVKERKKPGLKRARRAPQWSKR